MPLLLLEYENLYPLAAITIFLDREEVINSKAQLKMPEMARDYRILLERFLYL
jgi:hypothetical protein